MARRTLELQRREMLLHAESTNDRGSRVAILLHGFPDTAATFRFLTAELAERDFRVVVPVMRGYERSSCLHEKTGTAGRGQYTMLDIAEDILAWMDLICEETAAKARATFPQEKQRENEGGGGSSSSNSNDLESEISKMQFVLIGHDWGSLVAFTVTSLAPQRVSHMVNLAVPHPKKFLASLVRFPVQLLYSYYMVLFQFCYIAEFLLKRTNFVRRLWRQWGPAETAGELSPHAAAAAEMLAADTVVAAAAIGYYRSLFNVFLPLGRKCWRHFLGASAIPASVKCLAINGSRDGCIHPSVFAFCTRSGAAYEGWGTPSVLHRTIEDGGHWVHLEKPDIVNSLIVKWIAGNGIRH